ncbi:MAG: T9SS type A sorting domain-containing protein, partial [Candidatus Kryptoniota bacterium]
VEIVDVTNGIDKGDSVGVTPVLGTTLNANGTGDIALKDNGNGTVTIFVLATNNGLGAFTFDAKLTAVQEHLTGENPTSYSLSQNYPNPFNPTTVIEYSIPRNSYVTLKVYNVLGEEVKTLFAGERKAGSYSATFDGAQLASGIYFYRLQYGPMSITKKMMLVK